MKRTALKRTPMRRRPRRGGGMPHDVYQTVMMRNGGRCEARLPGICTGEAAEWHHRQRRQRGNDVPSNGLALCSACHAHITHVSPATGKQRGLIVSAIGVVDPLRVPFFDGHEWRVIDDDGCTSRAVAGDSSLMWPSDWEEVR